MIVNAAVFTCSICGEPSTNICAYCTKDACANHRCVRCKRCSDCCECEVPLSAEEAAPEPEPAAAPVETEAASDVVIDLPDSGDEQQDSAEPSEPRESPFDPYA
jgi:hypothetical protein